MMAQIVSLSPTHGNRQASNRNRGRENERGTLTIEIDNEKKYHIKIRTALTSSFFRTFLSANPRVKVSRRDAFTSAIRASNCLR